MSNHSLSTPEHSRWLELREAVATSRIVQRLWRLLVRCVAFVSMIALAIVVGALVADRYGG